MDFFNNEGVLERLYAAMRYFNIPIPSSISYDGELYDLFILVQRMDPNVCSTILLDFKFTFIYNGREYGCVADFLCWDQKILIIGDVAHDPNVGKLVRTTNWNYQNDENRYHQFEVTDSTGTLQQPTWAFEVPVWHPARRLTA